MTADTNTMTEKTPVRATYTSEKYDPGRIYDRYVRLDMDGSWHWCEVGTGDDKRSDYRQGIVDPAQLPDEVRERAEALQGYFPSYVSWPYMEGVLQ